LIPAIIVFVYLAIVLYIGIFAFRRSRADHEAEDYFLAGRSLGQAVFFLSLLGTNMTAFAILGSSGHAFANGIVTYGLMASSSALIIPLSLFFIGTRVWALGKKHGFMTPVQMFRDRWECSHTGTVIFVVQAALLVPYIIIGVMGGGTTLAAITGGRIPYWMGGALVALVVMSYVFFGGMRGTSWVNTFQTVLFLIFGAIAFVVIGSGMGGFRSVVEALESAPATRSLLTLEGASPLFFISYLFIPLSSIAFPHITIFCLTAKKMSQFKKTVLLYPVCMVAIWFPAVFLGVTANHLKDVPAIESKLEARHRLSAEAATLTPEQRDALRRQASGDDVLVRMLDHYAPVWLAGLLAAGIMAVVMASDSQILALSTMFSEDIFAYYGGKERFGEHLQVQTGRVFIILLTIAAYVIALRAPESIFSLAVQYAFSGYAALMPLLVAALFWRRSTKWGALAATLWVAAAVFAVALFQATVAPGWLWSVGGVEIISRTAGGTSVLGFMPVVPMVLISTLLMISVSSFTRKPSEATMARYFAEKQRSVAHAKA
jgi:SSS family solute:Na+ symporter